MRHKVLGGNFLFLSLALAACGGRSFPGSQDDVTELFPVGSQGGSSSTTGGAGGNSGGGSGVGGAVFGGSNPGGKGGFSGSTSTGGTSGKAGTGGSAGAGGAVGTCGTCVSQVGPNACPELFENCLNDTTCAALNACAVSNGCLDIGGIGATVQCVNKSCKSFANAFGDYVPYLNCAACSCQSCDIPCNPGTGGTGGAPGTCGSCVLEAQQDGLCPFEQSTCQNTKGCGEFGKCLLSAGCLDKPNPQQCGQQAGCNASQQARQAFRDLSTCLACDACQGTCPVPPDQCSPGTGGSGGGSLEEQCVACQEGAFNICQDSYFACVNNPSCNAILECFQGCPEDDDFCFQQCFDQNPQGQQGYYDVYYCYFCTACGDTCGQLAPDLCNSPGF